MNIGISMGWMVFKSVSRLLLAAALMLPLTVFCQAATMEENVCILCHEGLPGKLGEPVLLLKKSVHAENGIACNNCHGGDPRDMANAMSPSRGFIGAPKEKAIPSFCGRCHVGIMKDYLQSAHGKALGSGGPTCVTCHSNHRVLKASLAIINEKLCSSCHSFERAGVLKEAMQQTESSISAIEQRLTVYKSKGAETDTMEKGLFALRNRYRSLFHEVNTGKVVAESKLIAQDLGKLKTQMDALDAEDSRRKVAGAVAVGAALLAALLCYLLKKSYD